jgi:glutamyl-tRNA reductase
MEVTVTGISHRTAPVDIREQVTLPGDLGAQLLRTLCAERPLDEVLALDTCNRTELYGVHHGAPWSLPHLLGHIAQVKGVPAPHDTSGFYVYSGLDAVRHLFRVAASLDSQVVGEHEILGQLKAAYRQAHEVGAARFLLNKLLHRAFRVGKRVFTETRLGRGATSVPGVAVALSCQKLGTLAGRTVLLIGAGQTAELAARALARHGATNITIANRTRAKAQQLARALAQSAPTSMLSHEPDTGFEGCQEMRDSPALVRAQERCSLNDKSPDAPRGRSTVCATLADLPGLIRHADLVIASASVKKPLLTQAILAPVLRRKRQQTVIIDIGVPRNVEPTLGQVRGVHLYNMDDLGLAVAENMERRRREIPRAEAIVEHEVAQFGQWLQSLEVVPTIKRLQQHAVRLCQTELAKHAEGLDPQERERLEAFGRNLSGRMLRAPISFLRESSKSAPGTSDLAAIDLAQRMFGLDGSQEERD